METATINQTFEPAAQSNESETTKYVRLRLALKKNKRNTIIHSISEPGMGSSGSAVKHKKNDIVSSLCNRIQDTNSSSSICLW